MKKFYFTVFVLAICTIAKAQDKPAKKDNDHTIEVRKENFDPLQGDILNDGQEPKHVHNLSVLDVQPEFPGGTRKFVTLLESKIDKSQLKDVEPGKYRVFVSFVIEEDGTMTGAKLMRDPGQGIGNQVLQALNGITDKWKPGINDGKPVRVNYSLPVTINLP